MYFTIDRHDEYPLMFEIYIIATNWFGTPLSKHFNNNWTIKIPKKRFQNQLLGIQVY